MTGPTGPTGATGATGAASTGPTGAAGSAGGDTIGFRYTFNTATSGDPGSGKFLFNNATFASATQLNVSNTDGDGNTLTRFWYSLDMDSSVNDLSGKKPLVAIKDTVGTAWFVFYITGAQTDNSTYQTFPISPLTSIGTVANTDVCSLQVTTVSDFMDAIATWSGFTPANVVEVETGTRAVRMVLEPDAPSRPEWVLSRTVIATLEGALGGGANAVVTDWESLIPSFPGITVVKKVTTTVFMGAIAGARNSGVCDASLYRGTTDGGAINTPIYTAVQLSQPLKNSSMPIGQSFVSGNQNLPDLDTNPLYRLVAGAPATVGMIWSNDVLFDHHWTGQPIVLLPTFGLGVRHQMTGAATSTNFTFVTIFEYEEWTLLGTDER